GSEGRGRIILRRSAHLSPWEMPRDRACGSLTPPRGEGHGEGQFVAHLALTVGPAFRFSVSAVHGSTVIAVRAVFHRTARAKRSCPARWSAHGSWCSPTGPARRGPDCLRIS